MNLLKMASSPKSSMPIKVCRGVLMIRPTAFAFNEVTAITNAFQTAPSVDSTETNIAREAMNEFDNMVETLRNNNIVVSVVDGGGYPDEVFPNNWLVFLDRPHYATFPMCATTRRGERDKLKEVLMCVNETLTSFPNGNDTEGKAGNISQQFGYSQGIDFSESNEIIGKYMEGTGSIVFDHVNRLAYACISPRTDEGIVRDLCSKINYKPILFTSRDEEGTLVYHTNVLMSIGNNFSIICAESITDINERGMILDTLTKSGKTIVLLTFSQMAEFAGNMLILPVISSSENLSVESTICVCSSRAYNCLSSGQIETIEMFAKIVHCPLTTIETYGGGSARCMMAEFY